MNILPNSHSGSGRKEMWRKLRISLVTAALAFILTPPFFACSCLIKAKVVIAVNVDNSKRFRTDNDFLKAKRSAATCSFR